LETDGLWSAGISVAAALLEMYDSLVLNDLAFIKPAYVSLADIKNLVQKFDEQLEILNPGVREWYVNIDYN